MPIEYSDRERPYELFRKGKEAGTWNPDDFDFSKDVADWETFTEAEKQGFLATCAGFYDGEEDVTRTLAPYLLALDQLEDVAFDPVQEEMYLAQQLYEEAKHTDFFSQYFETVFETQDTDRLTDREYAERGYSTSDLYETASDLTAAVTDGDQRTLAFTLGEAYLNYMGIVEAQLARAGYMSFDQMIAAKSAEAGRDLLPEFQRGVAKIRQDESRHIENGRWVLARLAEAYPEIVSSVYEPRIEEYIDNRLLSEEYFEQPFEGYDRDKILQQSRQRLQDTIDYIGADRFDQVRDIQQAVERQAAD